MEEYNFCDEIREKYNIVELDSTTLSYRINGFINACNMDLSNSLCTKEISLMFLPYINKQHDDEKLKYSVNFARGYDASRGPYFIMTGKYNDLEFAYINYYSKDRNKKKLNEIPYRISLSKAYNDATYLLNIEAGKGVKPRFDVTMNKETETLPIKVTFDSSIREFEVVLNTVKLFTINPEQVFDLYCGNVEKNANEIIKKKFKKIKY